MRGEDGNVVITWWRRPGSPPHARGRRAGGEWAAGNPGITPACAGKTRVSAPASKEAGDHPRMRGEDADIVCVELMPAGSPPHARGRLPGATRTIVPGRITPACAGKTY